MPCMSDYQSPSGTELESRRVAQLLRYVLKATKQSVPSWVSKMADTYYGNTARLDEATKDLCYQIRQLTKPQLEAIAYDGRNPKARRLGGWWDRHQEWDRRRVKEESATQKKASLRMRALKKLTVDEIKALGLVD